jgi:PPOX class probable F420-dependent enzyme
LGPPNGRARRILTFGIHPRFRSGDHSLAIQGDNSMPKGPIPSEFHDLLDSGAFAFVSTIDKDGEPQVNPVWYIWDGTHILISLYERAQKYVNLKRNNRVAVAIANPANPYRYVEARGHVVIEPDRDDEVFEAISAKYTGGEYNAEPPGTKRYVGRIEVERYTFQAERPASTVEVPSPR